MLLILPPSESKRAGGAGDALDPGLLRFPELTPQRLRALELLGALADDRDAMAAALKVGPSVRAELEHNRVLLAAPTMPAIDRFTGVLFDALDAQRLDRQQRAYADRHLAIHSALFGLVAPGDAIPAYRLSHDSRLPGVTLKRLWREAIATVLEAREGIVLDLRSEAYSALGPIPKRPDARYVRVVADDGAGRRRALNHFNKKGKGEFVRALCVQRPEIGTIAELCEWSNGAGFPLGPGRDGELELVVRNSVAA